MFFHLNAKEKGFRHARSYRRRDYIWSNLPLGKSPVQAANARPVVVRSGRSCASAGANAAGAAVKLGNSARIASRSHSWSCASMPVWYATPRQRISGTPLRLTPGVWSLAEGRAAALVS